MRTLMVAWTATRMSWRATARRTSPVMTSRSPTTAASWRQGKPAWRARRPGRRPTARRPAGPQSPGQPPPLARAPRTSWWSCLRRLPGLPGVAGRFGDDRGRWFGWGVRSSRLPALAVDDGCSRSRPARPRRACRPDTWIGRSRSRTGSIRARLIQPADAGQARNSVKGARACRCRLPPMPGEGLLPAPYQGSGACGFEVASGGAAGLHLGHADDGRAEWRLDAQLPQLLDHHLCPTSRVGVCNRSRGSQISPMPLGAPGRHSSRQIRTRPERFSGIKE